VSCHMEKSANLSPNVDRTLWFEATPRERGAMRALLRIMRKGRSEETDAVLCVLREFDQAVARRRRKEATHADER